MEKLKRFMVANYKELKKYHPMKRDAMKLNLLKNEDLFDENDQLDEEEVDRIKNPLHYEKEIVILRNQQNQNLKLFH